MKMSTVAAGLIAVGFSSAANASSVDLEAYNPKVRLGALIAESSEVVVEKAFDTLFADDFATGDSFDVFLEDPSSAVLSLLTPTPFDGLLAPVGGVPSFAFDDTSAAALFVNISDPTDFRYAVLTLPVGTTFAFSAEEFLIEGATAQIYDIEVIPLPATLPLFLAGCGALALAGRRRKA